MSYKKEILLLIVLSVFASYISLMEYIKVSKDIIHLWGPWHLSQVRGESAAPLQYRILSFMLPDILINIFGIKAEIVYLTERFIFLFLTSIYMYLLSIKWLSKESGVISVALFFYMYNLSCFPHFQPSEEINIFLFLIAFYYIDSKLPYLLVVVFIASLNKSTIIFYLPIYFIYKLIINSNYQSIKENIKTTALLGLVIISTLFIIRSHYGSNNGYLGGLWQFTHNINLLLLPSPFGYNFIFISILPMILVYFSWEKQPPLIKAISIVGVPFIVGHFAISRIDEFRTYMVLAILLIPGSIIAIKYLLGNSSHK